MSVRSNLRRPFLASAVLASAACAGSTASSPAAAPAPAPASAAAAPAASMAVGALPAGVSAAMVAMGDSIFHKASCQRCHGMDAKGTPRAPDLTDATWSQISGSYADIVKIVTTGVPKDKIKMAGATFGMNPRGGTNLTDDQINAVAAYVYTLSHH